MRVFTVSDVHVDYPENLNWLLTLSASEFQDDVLILAGDLTDNLPRLRVCFESVAARFRQVLYVPGNHELWVHRAPELTSIDKFHLVLEAANDCGVSTELWHEGELAIMPLFSWYDFSFGEPEPKLRRAWGDFRACRWPDQMRPADITQHFLSMNTAIAPADAATLITFSHFLPRIDVMPEQIPQKYRYLYPVLGSHALGDQVTQLSPALHIYGHSHVTRQVTLDGVRYINNAYGYPSEHRLSDKNLLCIYDGNAPVA